MDNCRGDIHNKFGLHLLARKEWGKGSEGKVERKKGGQEAGLRPAPQGGSQEGPSTAKHTGQPLSLGFPPCRKHLIQGEPWTQLWGREHKTYACSHPHIPTHTETHTHTHRPTHTHTQTQRAIHTCKHTDPHAELVVLSGMACLQR